MPHLHAARSNGQGKNVFNYSTFQPGEAAAERSFNAGLVGTTLKHPTPHAEMLVFWVCFPKDELLSITLLLQRKPKSRRWKESVKWPKGDESFHLKTGELKDIWCFLLI